MWIASTTASTLLLIQNQDETESWMCTAHAGCQRCGSQWWNVHPVQGGFISPGWTSPNLYWTLVACHGIVIELFIDEFHALLSWIWTVLHYVYNSYYLLLSNYNTTRGSIFFQILKYLDRGNHFWGSIFFHDSTQSLVAARLMAVNQYPTSIGSCSQSVCGARKNWTHACKFRVCCGRDDICPRSVCQVQHFSAISWWFSV